MKVRSGTLARSIGELVRFAEEGVETGTVGPTELTPLRAVLDQSQKDGTSIGTVGELFHKYRALLQRRQAQRGTADNAIAAYETRLQGLLRKFDAAPKIALPIDASVDARPVETAGVVFAVEFAGGRRAEARLPLDISSTEIEALKEKLEVLQQFLTAQGK